MFHHLPSRFSMPRNALPAALVIATLACASPAAAQEAFAGLYLHGVKTPFCLDTEEDGVDVQAGFRFSRIEQLAIVGKPAPYVIASINSRSDTSFIGGGLSWKISAGPVYVRPEIGVVVHNGPTRKYKANGDRIDLGSPVLFEPGIAVGAQVTKRLSVEASWVHVSHAQLLNKTQNPGLDMWGVRLNLGV